MNLIKKSTLFLMAIVMVSVAVSCVKNIQVPDNDKVVVDYETVRPVVAQYFEVPEGKIAYVMNGSDTLGVLTKSGSILVPNMQGALGTRADGDFEVVYEDIPGVVSIYKYYQFKYVLMFEDTSNGDNDYNDLIIHVQQKFHNYGNGTNAVHLSIQPVAMGNTMALKLGADIYYCDGQGNKIKSGRFYFSEDVKSDLFKEKDVTKMLRTLTVSSPYTPFQPKGTTVVRGYSLEDESLTYATINYNNGKGMMPQRVQSDDDMVYVNWFIETADGAHRYYAIPSYLTNKEQWISKSGFPQGFAMCRIHAPIFQTSYSDATGSEWLNYPLETVNIETTYPGFRSWVEGNGDAPDWLNPVEGTFFDAIGNNGGKSLFEFNMGV